MIRRYETGGVSIFIVIFTALLLTVVTTSFVQLMIRNQQQATNNDLSQSAYDAALAGVEDAKRALVRLSECEGDTTNDCDRVRDAFNNNSQNCQFLQSVGITTFDSGEVVVGDDPKLNQAYTCVKVQLASRDVRGDLGANSGAKVIQLKAKDDEPIDKVRISWYTKKDARDLALVSADPLFESLPADSEWSEQTPSLLRSQLIQFKKGNISLDSFSSSDTSNARTAFLYPNVELPGGGPTEPPIIGSAFWSNDDDRLKDENVRNVPKSVECDPDNNEYFCSVTLTLPPPEGGDRDNREAYLQLAALYNATHFKVELLQGNRVIEFDGQQAVVDSTGRASALFRRVSARVSVKTPSPNFPDAALSLEGDLCKNFTVTSDEDDYSSTCSAKTTP